MNIWNASGKLLGSIKKSGQVVNVYDQNNQPAGKVRDTGTYSEVGCKLSSSKVAGLLFTRKK